MNQRSLVITSFACALLAALCIALLDRPVAQAVHGSALASAAFFIEGTRALDAISGRSLLSSHTLSGILLGSVLLACGCIGWIAARRARSARALVFTGLVQLATIASAWVLKDIFGRLRPFQVLASGDWAHAWFVGGNSFPSGHNAFFWGLFVPLAYLYPRWLIPLLLIPVYIALARVDASMHFVSDVLASIALACLVTVIAARLFERWIKPQHQA